MSLFTDVNLGSEKQCQALRTTLNITYPSDLISSCGDGSDCAVNCFFSLVTADIMDVRDQCCRMVHSVVRA